MMREMEDEFGAYDGKCAGCDGYGRIDDIGLCEDCSTKLERDLIRQRDWAYSMTAFGLSDKQRETVRRQVVRKFGTGLELIAPSRREKPDRKRKRKNRGRNAG